MKNTLTLYLATTEIDLARAAARVARALERLDDDGVRIEVISSRAGEPLAESTARAASADAVVVLSARLYGWVPAEEDGGDGRRSVTWIECQAAVDAGRPVLAYVLDSLSEWTHRTSPSRRARATAGARVARQLEQFKRWLGHEADAIEYFENPSQLPELVSFSVLSHARRQLASTVVEAGLTTLEDLAALDAALGPVEPEELELDDEPRSQGMSQAELRRLAPRGVRIETVRGAATRDRPVVEDALGMAPIVEAVTRLLTSEHTSAPLTVSVEGQAGTGKSSFLLQLRARMEAVHPTGLHVAFTAWRPGSEPWVDYALGLLDALERSASPRQRLLVAWQVHVQQGAGATRIGLMASALCAGLALVWALPLVGMMLPVAWSSSVALGGLAVACAMTALAVWTLSTALRFPVRATLLRTLRTDGARAQGELATALRLLAGSREVICYVDDLDRCDPEDAEALLRVQEALGDVIPLISVLALDPARMVRSLAQLLGESEAAGREVLERFVQLPVRLPRPDAGHLMVFLDQALDPLVGDSTHGHWLPGGPVSRGAPAVLAHWEQEEAEPRKEALEVQLGQDSATVRELVLALASGLDHNPRRLKRFVNAFRLSAYVASSTGVFAAPVGRGRDPLTLQQLGKVVALSQRWPGLLEQLMVQPALAGALEGYAQRGLSATATPAVRSWLASPALAALLRAGIETGEHTDEEQRAAWSLANVDWRRLSPLSPAVAPVARIGDEALFPGTARDGQALEQAI